MSDSVRAARREREEAMVELAGARQQVEALGAEGAQLKARALSAERGCSSLRGEMKEKLAAKEAESSKWSSELERLKKHLIQVRVVHTV